MSRTTHIAFNPYEDELRRLKQQLYFARQTIIELAPQDKRELLNSYYRCESRPVGGRWTDSVADQLVAAAEVLPETPATYYFGERAYCPLCGGESSTQGQSGFAYPEGLRRHLTGWGQMEQCPVLFAASRLAREHWDGKFSLGEREEEARKDARTIERLKTETVYRTAPDGDPELSDRGIGLWPRRNCRTAQQLAWAESRLHDLGFQVIVDGRIKSYVDEREECIVYADPRGDGEITFTLYKLPLPKKSSRSRPRLSSIGSFRLPDSWKHDLLTKYQKRVGDAVAR